MSNIRVRFAPSPTGGLHLGGVRTALYNYLFSKKNDGTFVMRVEDTDQTRFVEGAEKYIEDCLAWCGISPDEGPMKPGNYGPYRQSERKSIYREYAEKLVESGHAYYAFDTPEEIEEMRERLRLDGKHNLQYGFHNRFTMRNSLTLSKEETAALLKIDFPHVIRIMIEPYEFVRFNDMIRGDIEMSTDGVDDKVLLKADGMPTYHLAVVVDDYLMKITHAFRGEEWLPSAPVHVLLYKYLGWENRMPQWAHLPLILKPDGNGKLSKRDGERLGFPVFAMEWNDPVKGEIGGFKELGFLPEAFLNMLALLGWNDGTEQEIFTLPEMVEKFSMERVQVHGAKFDFEKAKWFNHEWIKRLDITDLTARVREFYSQEGFDISDKEKTENVVSLVRERCTLLTDFITQSSFFFTTPQDVDISSIQSKWTETKNQFFIELMRAYQSSVLWQHDDLEREFKELASVHQLKPGELMLPLRVMLVGGKFGPGVFDIASVIGKEETVKRIENSLKLLEKK
ncbi:MAG: glutamate--tRNA ligase [Ginsengibacter sp.]